MRWLILSVLAASGIVASADKPNSNHFLNTDVFELEVAADPRIAPDGSRIVYVLSLIHI